MKQRRRTTWLRRLAVGLALVAIAVPASASGGVPPGYVPEEGWTQLGATDPFESGVPGGGYIPDDITPTRPGPADPFESGVPGGGYIPTGAPAYPQYIPYEGPPEATPVVLPAPEPGFDWKIVAVGLGAGLAGLLAGAAVALATRRRGTPARA